MRKTVFAGRLPLALVTLGAGSLLAPISFSNTPKAAETATAVTASTKPIVSAYVIGAPSSKTPAQVTGKATAANLKSLIAGNPFAFIPPQCYTKTRVEKTDGSVAVHNPCYTCHVGSQAPNYLGAPELQTTYDFPAPAAVNYWTNLFVDRRAAIASTADTDILAYVRSNNYQDKSGLKLSRAVATLPPAWDINGDSNWSGYTPDIWFDFDSQGYDRTPGGTRTFWRAFAYAPLPGGFWPSNGSADDVSIRLAKPFREDGDGKIDWTVYNTNLAIVEALIKRADVEIPPTDERALGVDLDRDGSLNWAARVVFAFDPRNGITMSYVGLARTMLAAGDVHLAAGLYPEGTEFIHSLRYLDVAEDGSVKPSARMKELRYARKTGWMTYWDLREKALGELREEHDYPDRPERFFGDIESGISTGQGWRFQGFIEDAGGELRPQTFEESLTCAGCHAGIGRTVDNTFAFPRKQHMPVRAYGWYPWSPAAPIGSFPDPVRPDGKGEYATYLDRNGSGDEFRANRELLKRYVEGADVGAALAALKGNVAPLLTPSVGRALALDKAYRLIVRDQSYDRGRAPTLSPLDDTVHREVTSGEPTGIEKPVE